MARTTPLLYKTPARTKCKILSPGSKEWVDHVTKEEHVFVERKIEDNGGKWAFESRGWKIKVYPPLVIRIGGEHRKFKKPKPQIGTFNRSVLGKNGRGASRRRKMRR